MTSKAHGAGEWQLECGAIRERGARLLASEQWADCSFLPGAAAVPARAHRLILAMASPVFQAMFYGPVAEGDAPIPVPDIQPGVFNKLLQYVYTDEADLENYKIAFEVYYAAKKYMLPHLQTLCTAYLADNLSPQNACGIYEFANFIDDKELEDKCLEVIKDKTKLALSPDSSFEDLALGTVINIFSLNKLTIDSELDLLAAAERYVLAWQERHREMAELNTSASEVVYPEYDSVTNSIDENTDQVDTVKINPNSDDNIKNLNEKISIPNEAIVENQESTMTSDTQPVCPEVVNRARSEATFRFTVSGVSKMKNSFFGIESPPFYVRNLPWTITVAPFDRQKDLFFYVRCNDKSKSVTWSCKAYVDYRFISHKPNTEPYCRNPGIYHCFSSGGGVRNIIRGYEAWNDVLAPEKGYVQDGAITLEVRVVAEPPQGLSWQSKRCISAIDIKDESVRAILRQIRFLTLTAKELADYKPKLSLLTDHDIAAIMMNIASEQAKTPLPLGFSQIKIPRAMMKFNFSFHYMDFPRNPYLIRKKYI